jgi:hypothetical protein
MESSAMAEGSPKQFALDVAAFAKKAKGNAHLVVRKVVLELGNRVVMRSPVGDPSNWQHGAPAGYTGGHFRANWQYSTSAPTHGYLPDIDKSGQVSIDRIRASLPEEAWGKVHYLVNNLPYGPRLETGWSKQAPGGMVGVTVVEFQGLMAQAVKEVRG